MIRNTLFLLSILACSCAQDFSDATARFRITIENLSQGEQSVAFSPGVYTVQRGGFPLYFQNSQDFGEGLEFLAEDGVIDTLLESLANKSMISFGALPSIESGEQISLELTAGFGDFFNFANMFVESNDLFYSFNEDGIPLFEADGSPTSGDKTALVWLWDLGTEVNEQPYVGPNQATRQATSGAGIIEQGRVTLVNDGFNYPGKFSIIKVSITPL